MNRKLGRIKSKPDRRQLRLARYLTPALPPAPDEVDYGKAVTVPWGMYRNDELGDCVIAASCHMEMSWTANGVGLYVPTEKDCVEAYSAVTGYIEGDTGTDNGTDPVDALKYWRSTGIAGRKIGAWTAVDPHHRYEIQQSIHLFGGCYIGLDLPKAAQTMDDWGIPILKFLYAHNGDWKPGSWGGHMVEASTYDSHGVTCVTWGETKRISWDFLKVYGDGLYCVLSPDILRQDGHCPNGFDLPTLLNDLELVSILPRFP